LSHCTSLECPDWLADKETGTPFAIPALYQPASKIPLDYWTAGRNTTNVGEGCHSNINRDGTRLSLLAAVQRSYQADSRQGSGRVVRKKFEIAPRYQRASPSKRALMSVRRAGKVKCPFKGYANSWQARRRNARLLYRMGNSPIVPTASTALLATSALVTHQLAVPLMWPACNA